MNKTMPTLIEETDWLFRKMVRKFVKERDKIKIEGIMLPGFLILNKIIQDGEQRLTDLAEELDLTSGAITALCDKLEEKGLAVRKRNQEDRRIILLDITEDGLNFIKRNHNVRTSFMSVLFDGFSPEELQLQIEVFRRLAHNLEHLSHTIMKQSNENTEE
ncbi:MarR family transcriptional regulator [Bacillus mobilis]|uniref:MarR family winged helix-turn-helix transcriptional regulator n=1 Tax=Bacillus mobilis TaxID=2026190 RepID=UPI000BF9ED8D|nr:MarR family transcriptional regulator [Bacillus mobilis]PFO66953.1 MarR family transcriptional regulator [Bacillus cereus]MED0935837.1 MarR family transcriptional regulator [Bacillus mobilis]MED0952439.1 MarR family transcriptional regulator [Bacillus mobilis]MED0997970.1 MarR family transcriptional regulator [Bacillus mobilis]MED1004137.1 MarR family transcriptional regulator [Bacillus mobilis]